MPDDVLVEIPFLLGQAGSKFKRYRIVLAFQQHSPNDDGSEASRFGKPKYFIYDPLYPIEIFFVVFVADCIGMRAVMLGFIGSVDVVVGGIPLRW